MAFKKNSVELIGRIGRDIEVKFLPSGQAVANFTMATDEGYFDKENKWVDKAEWHNVVVFGKQAETLAEKCGKGSMVYVTGSLQTRKWQDKDGNDRYTTEIKAHHIQREGKASTPASGAAPQQGYTPPMDGGFGLDEGIDNPPF